MYVLTFAEIQPEFMARASKAVYASMATIDLHGRPRTRIVHPVWENEVGWILSVPTTPKIRHIARVPHVSLAYIHDFLKPVYIDAVAEWHDERDEKLRVWDVIKAAPPPIGFDPEPHYGSVDHPHFSLIKLIPSRIELYTLREESIIWKPA